MHYDVTTEQPPGYACASDPDRWTTTPDEGAKALCRACSHRWLCAQEACKTPGAEGVWAGVLIPAAGRGRRFALEQLGSLADRNGFPVRMRPQHRASVVLAPQASIATGNTS